MQVSRSSLPIALSGGKPGGSPRHRGADHPGVARVPVEDQGAAPTDGQPGEGLAADAGQPVLQDCLLGRPGGRGSRRLQDVPVAVDVRGEDVAALAVLAEAGTTIGTGAEPDLDLSDRGGQDVVADAPRPHLGPQDGLVQSFPVQGGRDDDVGEQRPGRGLDRASSHDVDRTEQAHLHACHTGRSDDGQSRNRAAGG